MELKYQLIIQSTEVKLVNLVGFSRFNVVNIVNQDRKAFAPHTPLAVVGSWETFEAGADRSTNNPQIDIGKVQLKQ